VTGETAIGLAVTVATGLGMDKQLQADEIKGLALNVAKQAGLATGVDLAAVVTRFWRAVDVKQGKSAPKVVAGIVTVSTTYSVVTSSGALVGCQRRFFRL
jgi:hypothetical protein